MSDAKQFIIDELETLNTGDPGKLASYFTEDCKLYDSTDPDNPAVGRDGVVEYCRELTAAMPDFHIDIDAVHQDGDTVIAQITLTGTHTGKPFRGFEAAGGTVRWVGCCVYRLTPQHDAIIQEQYYFDSQMLDRQLAGAAG
jgi:predicted ester cyclase